MCRLWRAVVSICNMFLLFGQLLAFAYSRFASRISGQYLGLLAAYATVDVDRSMLVWRHHCRYCGGVFCGECADKEFLLMPPRDSADTAVCPPCACPNKCLYRMILQAHKLYRHEPTCARMKPPAETAAPMTNVLLGLVCYLRDDSIDCRLSCFRQSRGCVEDASPRCRPAEERGALDRPEVRTTPRLHVLYHYRVACQPV